MEKRKFPVKEKWLLGLSIFVFVSCEILRWVL